MVWINKLANPVRLLTLFGFLIVVPISAFAEGKLVDIVVHSPALEVNLLEDSADRNVTIYLPPGYDEHSDQHYPVIYLLHGWSGNNWLWKGYGYVNLNIGRIADALIEQGNMRPMIIVMPDADNKYWGSFYTNSSVTGNWEDFIVQDLVRYIDRNYRTIAQPESRGIAGHSMGGYGAIYLGMKYPEVYSTLYAMSAGAVVMEQYVRYSQGNFLQAATWDNFGGKNYTSWLVKVTIALAAAVAPNPDKAPFMADFPLEEIDGEIRFVKEVWPRWLAHDPFSMLSEYGSDLARFRGIRIDCGSRGELIEENRMFSQALTEAGIPHVFEEYNGDHTSGVGLRIENNVLPFFSETLAFESEPTAAEDNVLAVFKTVMAE